MRRYFDYSQQASKTEVETKMFWTLTKTPFIVENGAKLCDIQCVFQSISETDKEFGIDASELDNRIEKLGDLSFVSDLDQLQI